MWSVTAKLCRKFKLLATILSLDDEIVRLWQCVPLGEDPVVASWEEGSGHCGLEEEWWEIKRCMVGGKKGYGEREGGTTILGDRFVWRR